MVNAEGQTEQVPVEPVVLLPVDGRWLREIGFTFHAIGRYYYMTTINDVLLVKAMDSELDPHVQWCVSVVAGHLDPREYDSVSAMLTGRATRNDITTIIEICERERDEM